MRRLLLALVLAAACGPPPIATPSTPVPDDPCPPGVACVTGPSKRNKVDVLLVLDDGPTMDAQLAAWRAAIPELIDGLKRGAEEGAPLSYHIGVITSDLGAGPAALPAFGCVPGGDGAKLRATADMEGGVRYVDYNQLTNTTNVPDVVTTLTALSDVGTAGCAFGAPLEAAYRALHDQVPENVGFLRSDAVLAVVFVSNVDDCSAPFATDLFDTSSDALARYGTLDRFRCTQFGVQCNGMPVPPMSVSGLTGCSSYDQSNGGQLTAVGKYVDFFLEPAAQGGVKVDPNDVILAGITAPPDPIGVSITSPCAGDPGTAMCPTLNPSCVSIDDPRFRGDPGVRLHQVISAARHSNLTSACETSDVAVAKTLVGLIFASTEGPCLNAVVDTRADGTPDCVVTDVTTNPDGSQGAKEIPSCAENGGVTPCWRLVDHLAEYDSEGCMPPNQPEPRTCLLPPSCQPVVDPRNGMRQLDSIQVDRGLDASGNPIMLPAGTVAQIECATIVSSN